MSHCKRSFNVVNRCLYCTRFYVDLVRLSVTIQKSLCFKKTDFDPDIVKTILSESFHLNVHYVSAFLSVHNDCDISSATDFGVLYYDSVCTPMSLYILYLEIYVRLFVNLMRKKVFKVLIESSSDRKERYNPRYYFHRVTQSKSRSFF